MAYTPENNPYIPGDPYSYDLKWMVSEIDKWKLAEEGLDHVTEEADRAKEEADRAKDEADRAADKANDAADSASDAHDSELAAKDYADNIADPVSGLVTTWLADHITQPTTPAIDTSLMVAGAAADAKAAGDAIRNNENHFDILAAIGFDNNYDESGYINNGADAPGSSYVRTSSYYECDGWNIVYIKHENGTESGFVLVWYDSAKQFLSNQGSSSGGIYFPPSGAAFFRCYKSSSATGNTYISNNEPETPTDYNTIISVREKSLGNLLKEQPESYNTFDNDFDESGYINNGANTASSSYIRTSKWYSCKSWKFIFIRNTPANASGLTIVYYDDTRTFISNQGASTGGNYSVPSGAAYFRLYKTAGDANVSYISGILPVENMDLTYSGRLMIKSDLSDVNREEFLDMKRKLLNTENRTIVNFGDSIVGNTQDATSISAFLSNLSGYDCINAGFGGCQMSNHNVSGWSPFSMCNLADAIVNNDWTAQDASWADRVNLNLPYYFGDTITALKAIDFNDVYMITIEYGTNDWSAGVALNDPNDPLNKNTYAGSLRYAIETLLTAFPNLLIVIQNPTPRVYMSGGIGVETSDTKQNSIQLTLVDYIETENSVCKEYKLPTIDAYYESNFNYFTHDKYYASASDDVHLGYDGRLKVAEIISSYLISHFK